MTLNSTMIRERCVIKDASMGKANTRILSNRLVLPIGKDSLVIRGQNMHSVIRMAARLYNEATLRKLSIDSSKGVEFAGLAWDKIFKDTQTITQDNWIAVYINGLLMYKSADHHPFLDLIETQAMMNDSNYDMNVMIAAETFTAAGHIGMSIDHNSNVALILSLSADQGRCGLIYRHPRRTTTFSFSVSTGNDKLPKQRPLLEELSSILEVSADFLESIQLCYAIAAEAAKGPAQDLEKQITLKKRLYEMQKNIDAFESALNVTYRPERPDFNRFLQETQLLLAKKARA